MQEKNEDQLPQNHYDSAYSFYSKAAGKFGQFSVAVPEAIGDCVGNVIFGDSMLAIIPGMMAFVFPGLILMIPAFLLEVGCAFALGVSAPFVLGGAMGIDTLNTCNSNLKRA